MALRDQPYLPLYVQDYLTDEKLSMCSWTTQGVYIKLLCLLHKSDPYGTILLKQNDKQTQNIALNFAIKITRLLPIDKDTLCGALTELIDEGCLTIQDNKLYQKRMVRDNKISELRSQAGSIGGKKTQQFAKAKTKAKSEIEDEYDSEDITDIEERGTGGEESFTVIPPSIEAVSKRMKERNIISFTAEAFCAFYQSKGWKVGKEKMKNWDAALTTWENRHKGEGSTSLEKLKYKTYDEVCQMALTNPDIWKQMLTLNLPSMPKPIWAHPNEVASHGLSQYIVKPK